MRRLLLAALIALPAAPARAAYEDLGAGARAAGLGNAFVPVADDAFAIYHNPAGLGLLERPELGTSYTLHSPGLTDGSTLSSSFVALALPLDEGRRGAVGTAWNSFSLDSVYREDSLYLSYGRLFWASPEKGDLYAGGSLKYLRSSFGNFPEASDAVAARGVVGTGKADPLLGGSRTRTAIDGDAGLLYRLGKNYSFGLSASHVNQPDVAFGRGDKDRLPLLLKAGFDYRSLISNLVVQYDTQRGPTGGRDQSLTVGAERWFPHLFVGDIGARGAIRIGSRDEKEVSAGVSFRTKRLTVDYSAGFPLGGRDSAVSSHRVSLGFRFGRRTEEEESLEMVLEAMKKIKAGQPVTEVRVTGERSKSDRLVLEEYLAQARAAESRARYQDALEKYGLALQVAPADGPLLERYGRLNFVGRQVKSLPEYKTDPMQAALHVGLMAYVSGNNAEAIHRVSEALRFKPDDKSLEALLTQLEVATGLKRASRQDGPGPDRQVAVKLTQANAAIEDGEYEKAVELSLSVLRVEPKNAAAWEYLGTAYFALKAYENSLRSWQKAYDHESNPAVRVAIKQTIASIRRALSRQAAAKAPAPAPLPQRPSLTSREVEDLFNQAIDHYTRREFILAKDLLEKILQADPENVEAQKALRRVKDELP